MIRQFSAAVCAIVCVVSSAHALSLLPTPPLSERVAGAQVVFVGTLIERVEKGEWVRAVLRVDKPLRGLGEDKRVNVIWRTRVADQWIYDAAEGQRGIAILDDKHEERYWLRADKFEPLAKLEEVEKMIAEPPAPQVPTFRQWVADGMPLPAGMMFAGGTPWFDESAGRERTPEEVYQILYGADEKPAPKPPPAAGGRPTFPAHWGEPPTVQTRDLRPLPGGYGRGSSTLARWITENMEKDARAAE